MRITGIVNWDYREQRAGGHLPLFWLKDALPTVELGCSQYPAGLRHERRQNPPSLQLFEDYDTRQG
jgi:hypothetical protein